MRAFLLLSSLLLGSCSLCVAEITVTAAGRQVSPGDIVRVGYEEETDQHSSEYRWEPKLEARCTSGTENIELTLYTEDDGYTVCWPNVCMLITPGQMFAATGDIGETPADLQIHREVFAQAGVKPDKASSAVITVYDEAGESMQFTLICENMTSEEVAGINTSFSDGATEVARYSADGRLLNAPAEGLNIVVYSDGTVRKVFHRH